MSVCVFLGVLVSMDVSLKPKHGRIHSLWVAELSAAPPVLSCLNGRVAVLSLEAQGACQDPLGVPGGKLRCCRIPVRPVFITGRRLGFWYGDPGAVRAWFMNTWLWSWCFSEAGGCLLAWLRERLTLCPPVLRSEHGAYCPSPLRHFLEKSEVALGAVCVSIVLAMLRAQREFGHCQGTGHSCL